MRKLFLLFLLFVYSLVGWSQNGPFFGHYAFNESFFNPSATALSSQGAIVFQHRSQWLGYSSSFDGTGGAPATQMITAVAPIRNFFLSSTGLILTNDKVGPLSSIQLSIPLTYSHVITSGAIHLGIAPGFFSLSQNFNELRPNEPDPLLQGGREVQTQPNLAAGITYTSNNHWHIGVGAINILEPTFSFGKSIENIQPITLSLNSGYEWFLSENIRINPSLLIRSNGKGLTFDLGSILTLNDKIWTGLSYRKSESIILFLGYSLLQEDKLKIGYSFDYVVQNRNAKSLTSHELFVKYDLPNFVIGGKKGVKTPRFSF
ncbi:MAG: type IX secretion system PorP/SprF family membrane protein [Marinoscillum sp.]|jgi:type IX secretion system PorP/SprF family membrane protein